MRDSRRSRRIQTRIDLGVQVPDDEALDRPGQSQFLAEKGAVVVLGPACLPKPPDCG